MLKKQKSIKIIIAIIIIIMLIIGIFDNVYATYPETITGVSSDQSSVALDVAGIILGAIQVIGYFSAVIIVVWMGIKYITSAPEGRAEVKKQGIIFVTGAFMLFASSSIVGWLKDSIITN